MSLALFLLLIHESNFVSLHKLLLLVDNVRQGSVGNS